MGEAYFDGLPIPAAMVASRFDLLTVREAKENGRGMYINCVSFYSTPNQCDAQKGRNELDDWENCDGGFGGPLPQK